MAIDTAEKRKAAAGISFHIFLGVTPNSAKDAEWRAQAAWGYSGIAAGLPPVVVPPSGFFGNQFGTTYGNAFGNVFSVGALGE